MEVTTQKTSSVTSSAHLGHGERALHDVVGVRVLEQVSEARGEHQLAHDAVAAVLCRKLEALLDDVAGEFLRREVRVVALEARHDLGRRPGEAEIQDVLDDVVAAGRVQKGLGSG